MAWPKGKPRSKAVKKKISRGLKKYQAETGRLSWSKGRKRPLEERRRISQGMKKYFQENYPNGKPKVSLSEEHRQKIRQGVRACLNEGKIPGWPEGRARSKAEKVKISQGMKRHYDKKTPFVRVRNKVNYSEPYNYDGKLKLLMKRIDASGWTLSNKKMLNRYREDLQLTTKNGHVYSSILCIFNLFRSYEKPFNQITESEALDLYRHIQGNGFSDYTKADKIFRLKGFLKWLNDGYEKPYFRKMKTRKKLKVERYISLENIKDFINACESTEEKAFFSLLWEGGFAVSELLNVRREDIVLCSKVNEILVRSKQRDRITPILRKKGLLFPLHSSELLERHLANLEPKPEQRVWTFQSYNQLQYRCKKIRDKLGLRHVHIHSFRKARATYNDEHGMSYAQNCVFGGWRIGSRTLQHYILTSGKTLVPTLRQMNESEPEDDAPQDLPTGK